MAEECLTIKIPEVSESKDIHALSQYLGDQKRNGKIGAYSFLLADNRDMGPNDFARDLRLAFECPSEKLEDITACVEKGECF